MSNYKLIHGNCIEKMCELSDNSIDAVVTDPPYELGFMGKSWDASGIAYNVEMWKQCLRVLKSGGHLLAFGGSRTYHRMACAIEDAGFEVRDQMMWVYGSGFPKSHNISKALDKAAGAEREVVGINENVVRNSKKEGGSDFGGFSKADATITAPSTDAAKQWDGWGTALKPAHEPICVARKPLEGTVAANVLKWGTGAINIAGCRVGTETSQTFPNVRNAKIFGKGAGGQSEVSKPSVGRWPANLMHDGSQEVLELFPGDQDTTAARFFYCPKASKKDRDEGCEGMEEVVHKSGMGGGVMPIDDNGKNRNRFNVKSRNHHPTVKPTELMRYLCRLVTPKGGIVLDPFSGSGSTGKAAILEGFRYVGIEQDAEYIKIAEARIKSVL